MIDKKTVLIVGGSGGIGTATGLLLAEHGFSVCSTYHRNLPKEKPTHSLSFFQMDSTDETSVTDTISKIQNIHSSIDVVVFLPTLPLPHTNFFDIPWSDIESHFTLQVKGLYTILQGLKGQIKNKHKTKFIVVLTEYCIGKPPAGLAGYITAKYGLLGFGKVIASELGKYQCTVNFVSPGIVETPLTQNVPKKFIELSATANPLGRITHPFDVANTILFLAADSSDYLNGANIVVNGGSTMI